MGDVTDRASDDRPTGQPPEPLGRIAVTWLTEPRIRNYWLKSGTLIVAVSACLTLVLVGITVFELGNILDAAFKGLSSNSSSTGSSSESAAAGDILKGGLQAILFIWTLLFFSSHLAPYEVGVTGGAVITVTGIGSLTIGLVTALMSFMLGRRLERRSPRIDSNGVAALRAAMLAVPMLVASLVLFIVGSGHFQVSVVTIDFHPSFLGVLTPGLLVSAAGALGALSVRPTQAGVGQPNGLRRGVVRGLLAIATGLVVMIVFALIGTFVNAASTHNLNSGSVSPTAPSGGVPDLTRVGVGLLALAPFYLLNLLGVVRGTCFHYGHLVGSPTDLLVAAPPLGALIACTFLRRPPDRGGQMAFALTFALGSALLAYATVPSSGHDTLGISVPVVFVEGLAIGGVAAFVAPFLTRIPIAAGLPGFPPIAWLAAQVFRLAPEASTAAPYVSAGPGVGTHLASIAPPRQFRIGWQHLVLAGVVASLPASVVGANAYFSSLYGPENAVRDYYRAQAAGSVDALWAAADYATSEGTVAPTLSKEALRDMLQQPINKDVTDVQMTGVRDSGLGKSSVTVSFLRGGERVTRTLSLHKDSSKSHYGIYPTWRVEVPPTHLSINTFKNPGSLKVDSIPVAYVGPSVSVAVIPGQHRVEIEATAATAGDMQVVDSWSGTGTVTFKPMFKPGAQNAALTSLRRAFAKCAASADFEPVNCPNSGFKLGDTQGKVNWSLVDDPTSDAEFVIGDDPGTIKATGHFRMKLSYDYSYGSSYKAHEDYEDNGPYSAILKANSSGDFEVVGFGRYL